MLHLEWKKIMTWKIFSANEPLANKYGFLEERLYYFANLHKRL